MSVNSKMTALADEVRELSGTTEAMSIDAMTSTLSTENNNFATNLSTQDDLLAQIEAALEGKAGGGSSAPALQDKTVTPTTSTQNITPDSGYDGLSKVTVNAIPNTYIQPNGTKTVTTNGTHDVKAYESVSVNVASTGEDVTAETNEYTEKITQLTTAVTALENELAGKASGGSGGNELCSLEVIEDSPLTGEEFILYLDGSSEYKKKPILNFGTVNVQKNSFILTIDCSFGSYNENLISIDDVLGSGVRCWFIKDDTVATTF